MTVGGYVSSFRTRTARDLTRHLYIFRISTARDIAVRAFGLAVGRVRFLSPCAFRRPVHRIRLRSSVRGLCARLPIGVRRSSSCGKRALIIKCTGEKCSSWKMACYRFFGNVPATTLTTTEASSKCLFVTPLVSLFTVCVVNESCL